MNLNKVGSENLFGLRFSHPSNFLISGVSNSGKTVLTRKILSNSDILFRPETPKYVILVYHTWQKTYQDMYEEGVVNLCLNQIPDSHSLREICEEYKNSGGVILVLDDQLNNLDSSIVDMFCIHSHHLKMSVILLVQTLFMPSKEFRTISLNSHYIILMKNVRDRSSITQLARQIFPYKTRFLTDSYIDATKDSYSHLVLDLRPESSELLRVRGNIFDDFITVYCQH